MERSVQLVKFAIQRSIRSFSGRSPMLAKYADVLRGTLFNPATLAIPYQRRIQRRSNVAARQHPSIYLSILKLDDDDDDRCATWWTLFWDVPYVREKTRRLQKLPIFWTPMFFFSPIRHTSQGSNVALFGVKSIRRIVIGWVRRCFENGNLAQIESSGVSHCQIWEFADFWYRKPVVSGCEGY